MRNGERMKKIDTIRKIAAKTGFSQTCCEQVVDGFIEAIKEGLINENKVTIKGFVSFSVKDIPERKARHPKTGEITTFSAMKRINCKVSDSIKNAVNGK